MHIGDIGIADIYAASIVNLQTWWRSSDKIVIGIRTDEIIGIDGGIGWVYRSINNILEVS